MNDYTARVVRRKGFTEKEMEKVLSEYDKMTTPQIMVEWELMVDAFRKLAHYPKRERPFPAVRQYEFKIN